MKDRFYVRTNTHVRLFFKYFNLFYETINKNPPAISHDSSKYKEPELVPYIYITWQYYCKDRNIPFEADQNLKDLMNKATEHHVRTNRHHPEYWSDRTDNLIPKGDRDKFDPNAVETIDVSKTMPKSALIEMCADWCAMSEERGNTPFEWAEKVINKRWQFGKEKEMFIYKVLNLMWEH
jgi:hypothetical protein